MASRDSDVDPEAQKRGREGDGAGEAGRFVTSPAYRDLVWAILFYIHLAIIIYVAAFEFPKYKDAIMNPKGPAEPSKSKIKIDTTFDILLGVSLLAASLVSLLYLYLLKAHAAFMTWMAIYCVIGLLFVGGIASFVLGNVIGGVLFLLMGGLAILFVYWVRDRIPFAIALIELVMDIVSKFPAVFGYAFGSMLIQAAFVVVWVLALLASMESMKQSNGPVGLVIFFLLLSLFWSLQVIKNVMHVTVSGLTGQWYFYYPLNMPPNPTSKAARRATTYSFGSICLGSLIVATIQAIRAMVRLMINRDRDNIVMCIIGYCIDAILSCIEAMLLYFNKYAYVHVAIYGKDFITAGKDAWSLIMSRGFDMIVNDDIVGFVLVLGAFFGALCVGFTLAPIAYVTYHNDTWVMWLLIGLAIGLFMMITTMAVVESAVATVFVCFAEDPAALSRSKPEEYRRLQSSMRSFYADFQRGDRAPLNAGR